MKMNTKSIIMKNLSLIASILIALCASSISSAQSTINTLQHYDLRPELLDETDPPNIMIVFDNSGSMTWSLAGFGLNGGASNVNSRSYIARTAMQQVFNSLQDTASLGLSVYSAVSCGSNTNNWGSLRANIAPFNAAANANFQNLLATEDNSNAQAPGIIRSGGCTPIAATLDTVQDYVTGTLAAARNQTGGAVNLPPNLQCSTNNAVILVSDGSANGLNPNIGCNVNNATTCSTQKVTELETNGWETYVVGFGGAPGLANNLNAIAGGASDDDTNLPRQFYPAANGAQLVAVFNSILGDIFQRASSGTAAAVGVSSNQDAGFFVQSSYLPVIEGTAHDGTGVNATAALNTISEEAYWAGISRMLFVDPLGYIREDTNNNKTFDALDYDDDRAIRLEIDSNGKSVFRRLTISVDLDNDGRGVTVTETGQGSQLPISELNGLWELNESLDDLYKSSADTPTLINNEIKLPNDEIKLQRNTFSSVNRRYIITNIDGDQRDFTYDDGLPLDDGTLGYYGPNPIQASEIGYLGLQQGQTELAKNLIDWVRGADDSEGAGDIVIGSVADDGDTTDGDNGLRNRTVFTDSPNGSLDFQRFLLGDTIHTTPVVVGPPSEPFFDLYGDTSYRDFKEANKNRRTVAYLGTNDGMIHAVNTGIYNPVSRNFAEGGFPIGFEMWAYIPQSVLPHLRFLAANNYTANNHVYGVDGPIVVKDVKINGNWKTYLFASTGYGGFDHEIDTDVSDATSGFNEMLTPSILILDVTNPNDPPIFVAELNDNFGATTVTPSVFHRNGESYLAVGTGPSSGFTDNAKRANNNVPRDEKNEHFSSNQGEVFIYKLNANSATLTTTLSGFGNGFIGDIASIDWDLVPDSNNQPNFDALYFGLNSGSGENNDLSGKLIRATLNNNATQELMTGYSFDNKPFITRDGDQAWVFAGSGRVNSKEDFKSTEQNKMFGVQESLDNNRNLIVSPTPGFSESNFVDVSGVRVQIDGDLVNTGNLPAPQDTPEHGPEIDTFFELADEIKRFHRGWVREFNDSSPSQRNPGPATTPGANVLTYIGFTPADASGALQCSVSGTSDLFTTSFSTGTAPYDEALDRLFPNRSDEEIEDVQNIADTLVREFTSIAAEQGLFENLLLEEEGGSTDPEAPTGPIPNNECNLGDTVNGICIGADGTNPQCQANLPGECGFGRKSFHEIDFRYFR